jgi:hypothetical protein
MIGWQYMMNILRDSAEDVLVLVFYRHPDELEVLHRHFENGSEDRGFLRYSLNSSSLPFDCLIKHQISNEIVVRDVLASAEDSSDGSRYNVDELS